MNPIEVSVTKNGLSVYLGEDCEAHLHCPSVSDEIDLRQYPTARSLRAPWPYIKSSLPHATELTDLYLTHVGEKDFHRIATLTQLQNVTFEERVRLQSLDGIDSFPGLRKLKIMDAPKLTDITALRAANLPQLTRLSFDICPNLNEVSAVVHQKQLTRLYFSSCGYIPSVDFLAELTQLVSCGVGGTTVVVDGDMTPFLELPLLREGGAGSSRNYFPDPQEVQDVIERRGKEYERSQRWHKKAGRRLAALFTPKIKDYGSDPASQD